MNAGARIAKLREEICRHQERYYVLDDPAISNAEFDSLLRALETLEREHPGFLTPDSPTQRVGGRPGDGFTLVEHAAPMLSVDNAFSEDELRVFDARVRRDLGASAGGRVGYVVEWKIDGLAIAVRYHDGRLSTGATRGDGLRGEDVSTSVHAVRHLPKNLAGAPPGTIEVRGEIYLSRIAFERLNRKQAGAGEPLFRTARTAAAKTMRNLDPVLVSSRGLRAFFYELLTPGTSVPGTHAGRLIALRRWGLPVEPHWRRLASIDEVCAFCRNAVVSRHTLPFDTDGIVIKVDDLDHCGSLGCTTKFPRWSMAFKFSGDGAPGLRLLQRPEMTSEVLTATT